jgi:hypothetical protein
VVAVKSVARMVLGLGGQECTPGWSAAVRCGSMPASLRIFQTVEAATVYPRPGQFAVDPPVSPGWVVAGHFAHQVADRSLDRRAAGTAAGVAPSALDVAGLREAHRITTSPRSGAAHH